MRWIAHIEGGPRRVNHGAVCIGDRIYSFGGFCSTDEFQDWEAIPVHVLFTDTLRWTPVNYLKNDLAPFQGYGHSVVSYGHQVYLWGGRNNSIAFETLSVFDTKKLEWTVPNVTGMVPYAKDGHSACVIKNKMYIFGGFEYLSDQYSQEIHCLNMDTFHWTYLDARGDVPSHRDFHTAVAVGNRMYIFGGRGDRNSPHNSLEEVYCSKVYYLDTITLMWVEMKPTGKCPENRRSHSAWLHEGYMYIFGGYNGNTKAHYNDLFRYSIEGNYWQEVEVFGTPPCKRRRQAGLIVKDKVFIFGGSSPCPHNFNRMDLDETERLIDNNDLHVLDYSPSLKTLCILIVVKHNLDQSILPQDLMRDIQLMVLPNRITRPINFAG